MNKKSMSRKIGSFLIITLLFTSLLLMIFVGADVSLLRPDENGYTVTWDFNSVGHWQDTSDNNDNTFIHTNTALEYESVGIDNISGTGSIAAVQVIYRCNATGSGGPEKIDTFLRISGNNEADLTNTDVGGAPLANWSGTNFTENPAGGSWTESAINTMEVVIYSDSVGGTEMIYCSEIYVVVVYTEPIVDNPPYYNTGAAYSGVNDTTPNPGDMIMYYSWWSDDNGLSLYNLEWNQTDSWVNQTWQASPENNTWHNYSIQVPTNAEGKNISAKIWANDSALNQFNATGLINITVQNIAPTITLPVYTNATPHKSSDSLTYNISVIDTGIGADDCVINVSTANAGNVTIAVSDGWCNGTYALTGAIEGNQTITVWANDTLGNSAYNNSYVVFIDNTAPTITLPVYPNATFKKDTDSLTYNISVSDSGVGADDCTINVSTADAGNVTVAVSDGWCNGTYSLTGTSDGNKSITVWANDTAGNTALNNSYVVQMDSTAPTITLPVYINATKHKNTESLTYNISVVDGAVDDCTINVNTAALSNVTVAVVSGWCNGTYNLAGATDGNQTIFAYANDTVGNTALNDSYVVFIDTTKPTLTLDSPSNDSWYNKAPYFNGTCSDSGTGLDSIYTNLSEYTTIYTSSPFNFTNTSALSDGTIAVRIYCNDTANNTATSDFYFNYDKSAPIAAIYAPANTSILTDNTPDINFSLVDNMASAINYTFFVNGSANITGVRANASNATNATLDALPEGLWRVLVQATDNASNHGNSSEYWYTVDTTAPTITHNSPTNNSNYSYAPYINGSCSDSGSGISSIWTNLSEYDTINTTSPYNFTNTSALTSGVYATLIYCNDSVNNTASEYFYFTFDNINPNATINAPQNDSTTQDTSPDINITLTDNLDTIINYTFYLNDTINLTGTIGNNSPTNITMDTLEYGLWLIIIEAEDNTGNKQNSSTLYLTIQAPTDNSPYYNTTAGYLGVNDTTPNPGDTVEYYSWWSDDNGLSMYNLDWNETGSFANQTWTSSPENNTWHNYSILVPTNKEGKYISAKIWANDTSSQFNVTTLVNITVNNVVPAVTNLEAGPDPVDIYNTINVNATVTDIGIGVDTVLIEIEEPDTTKTNYTTSISGNIYYNDTISVDQIGSHTYRIYANDSAGNNNYTETSTFNVQDNTAPTYSDVSDDSDDSVVDGVIVNVSVLWSDSGVGLDIGIFRHNVSGWANISECDLSSSGWCNETIDTTGEAGNYICWNQYANDTLSNMNTSMSESAHCFTVTTSNYQPYSVEINDIDGNSNNSYTNNNTPPINFTVKDGEQSTLQCELWINDTIGYGYNGSVKNNTATILEINQSLEQELFTVYINCSDGSLNNQSDIWWFKIDTTAPTISIDYPSNNSYIDTTIINITGTASDTNSDSVVINDSRFGTNQDSYSAWNFTNSSLAEETYVVKITANDSAGNENSSVLVFTIDRTSPVISHNSPTNNSNFSYAPYFNGTCLDTNLDSIWTNLTEYPTINTSSPYNFTNTTNALTEQTYYVTITCNDSAGNEDSEIFYFTFDVTAPIVNLNLPEDNFNISSQAINFNFTATDNISLTMNCSLYIDNVYKQSNVSTENNTLTNLQETGIAQESHNWTIKCKDSVENEGTSTTRDFYIDLTSPEDNDPTNAGYFPDSVATIGWILTDEYAEGYYYVERNETLQNSTTAWINNTNLNIWVNTTTFGAWNYTIFYNDSVGNDNSDEVIITITSDSPPTVTLNSPGDYYTTDSSSITFNCTAYDNINLTNVSLYGNWTGSWLLNETNSSPINNTPTIFSKIISEGIYVWNCKACDNATMPQCIFAADNRTFTIDTTPPTVTLPVYINATAKKSSDNLTYNISVSDFGVGPDDCTINVETATAGNITVAVVGGWCNGTYSLAGATDGNQTINAYANDTVGNYNLNNSYVVQVDSTNPTATINQPSNNSAIYDTTPDINITLIDNIFGDITYNIYLNNSLNKTGSLSNNTPANVTLSDPLAYSLWLIKVEAVDEAGNRQNSSALYLTIQTAPDNPPYYNTTAGYLGVNTTTPNPSDVVEYYSWWSDDNGLSLYTLEWNGTGTWANQTWTASPGNNTWYNYSITVPSSSEGKLVSAKIWANDTSNKFNLTTLVNISVQNVAPSVINLNADPDPVEIYNIVNISANVTDIGAGIDTVLIEVTEPDSTKTNYTTIQLGNIYYNETINTTQLGSHTYRFYSNDTVSNRNNTETSTFNVQDDTVPTYSDDSDDSGDSVVDGVIVNVSVLWSDSGVGLDTGIFRHNVSGWANVSECDLSSSGWCNETIDTTGLAGEYICWNQYANDTLNNMNTSMSESVHCFSVAGSYLEMELIEPTGTLMVKEGNTFLINASITCRNKDCGAVNLTPRYNNDLIPEGSGVLYIDNNTQLQNCTLNKDETCYRNWTVYTTTVGTWNIDINATPFTNDTSDAVVSVYRVIRVVVGGGGGRRIVEKVLEIPSPLLDLEIVNLTPRVFAGTNVTFTINLTNVGNITKFDVIMHKRIIKDDKVLIEKVVTKSMESGLLLTDTLEVPKNLDAGTYFFEVYIEYVGKNASALMVLHLLKDCLTMSDTSYDIFKNQFVIYTDELKNIPLKFKNKCDFKLTDTFLSIDGSKIDVGTVPLEGFEISVDFDKYRSYNLKIEYNEGYSMTNFYLSKMKKYPNFYILSFLALVIIILIIFFIYYKKFKRFIKIMVKKELSGFGEFKENKEKLKKEPEEEEKGKIKRKIYKSGKLKKRLKKEIIKKLEEKFWKKRGKKRI